MALLLHYTGQDYISRGLLNTELTPGSTSAIVGGCKTGKGFVFDGTVNSALFGNEIIEDTPNASFSFWYKHELSEGNQTLFCIQGDVSLIENTRLLARTLNNRISFGVRNASQVHQYISSNTLLTIDTWYHLTFILEESESKVSLYINGQYDTMLTWTGVLATSNQPIVFGKRAINYNIEPLMGQICNFKYYNHVLSAREIAEDYKSLMLHYKLDKPITTQVTDYSGFNRHITNLTSNTVTLDSNSQVYSASLKNDSTQSLVGTSDLTDLNGLNEGSFSFRAFLTTNISDQYVICNMTTLSSGNGISFSFRNSVVVAFFYGTRIQFNYRPTVDAWHHIVLVKTSTQIKVYADNVNIYTVSATTSSTNFSNITSISSMPTGSFPFTNGNIQDIRFYAKALTQEDVTELYQTRHMVDKDSNQYAYELVEDTDSSRSGMKGDGSLIWNEFKERIVYPSKYWYTPSYSEIYYILNTRPNASNLKGFGRIQMVDGTYANGAFLLPDDFTVPDGLAWTATTADYTTNTYTLEQFRALENVGAVFIPHGGIRDGVNYSKQTKSSFILSTELPWNTIKMYFLEPYIGVFRVGYSFKRYGYTVRLVHTSPNGKFSTPSGRIDFASGNLQYHCTQHTWRFAQHQYSFIGAANANISDSYNGWIDLFGYGTSGVNYSPTLHTTNDADYASGDITNTDDDWGINEIIENDILGMSEGVITAKEFKEI